MNNVMMVNDMDLIFLRKMERPVATRATLGSAPRDWQSDTLAALLATQVVPAILHALCLHCCVFGLEGNVLATQLGAVHIRLFISISDSKE